GVAAPRPSLGQRRILLAGQGAPVVQRGPHRPRPPDGDPPMDCGREEAEAGAGQRGSPPEGSSGHAGADCPEPWHTPGGRQRDLETPQAEVSLTCRRLPDKCKVGARHAPPLFARRPRSGLEPLPLTSATLAIIGI